LTLAANNDRGLTTTDGTAILLYLESGVVVGRAWTEAIFAIAIDANGQITVEQYDSIRHTPVPGFDTLAAIAAGRIFATVTVTDGDSDPASSSVDISGQIGFEDDGPSASLSLNTVTIVVDESVGADAGDPNAADEVGHGAGVIGWASLTGAQLFTAAHDFGEDEEGATAVYTLNIQSAQTALAVSNTNSLISLVQDGANAQVFRGHLRFLAMAQHFGRDGLEMGQRLQRGRGPALCSRLQRVAGEHQRDDKDHRLKIGLVH